MAYDDIGLSAQTLQLIDTGDYLTDFSTNIVSYLGAYKNQILFDSGEPDIKADFPLDSDIPPAIRVLCLVGEKEKIGSVHTLKMTAQVFFYCQALENAARKAQSWGTTIAKVLEGRMEGEKKSDWNHEIDGKEYLIRAYYDDIEITRIEESEGYFSLDGVVSFVGVKAT